MSRFIISDYVTGQPVVHSLNGASLSETLYRMGIPYLSMAGVVQGEQERSYYTESCTESGIREILSVFKQECALELNRNRGCGLLYPNGRYAHLGQWTTAYKLPKDVDSYTYNPANGLYLFVK